MTIGETFMVVLTEDSLLATDSQNIAKNLGIHQLSRNIAEHELSYQVISDLIPQISYYIVFHTVMPFFTL